MGTKYKRARLATMPNDPKDRFSRVMELWPDRADEFIEHCGKHSDRYKTLAQSFLYAGALEWHPDMRALFVRRACEFFACTEAEILTEKARKSFFDVVKANNGRKGSRGARWIKPENMPADPNDRLSSIVVKHGAPIVAMFIEKAKTLECRNPRDQKNMCRHVTNLLYARYDMFSTHFPAALKEFTCSFFGYERFEDCLTVARVEFLAKKKDEFDFTPAMMVKFRRITDALKQLREMGVSVRLNDTEIFAEVRGASHVSDFVKILPNGEMSRRKRITERASAGNEFTLADLEGTRKDSFVNQD
jgi:hypothetical protein